jgi:hypothetical protein
MRPQQKHFSGRFSMGGKGSGGRNKKRAARKRVEGNAGKRQTRKRDEAVVEFSGPLGRAPRHLHPARKKVWIELAHIVPIGTVELCDRWAFELLVCLMCKFRRGRAKTGEVTQIANLLARLGMTPADRSRVKPTQPLSSKPKPADPWAEFAPPSKPQ